MYTHPIIYHNLNPFSTFIISSFLYFGLSIAGPFSGGHLNPSVTVSLVTSSLSAANRIGYYVISQLLGAFFGGLIAYIFLEELPAPYP